MLSLPMERSENLSHACCLYISLLDDALGLPRPSRLPKVPLRQFHYIGYKYVPYQKMLRTPVTNSSRNSHWGQSPNV